MKLWEIVKEMSEGKYKAGDRFKSGNNELLISESNLLWWVNNSCLWIVLNDDREWEEVCFNEWRCICECGI